jgi:hypothetical protein
MSGDGKSISPESGKGKIAYDFGTDKHDCQLATYHDTSKKQFYLL